MPLNRLLLGLVCCLLATSCIKDNEEWANLEPGDRLPAFSVQLTDATVFNSQSLAGKGGMIVFFHTGCPDCQEELPRIQELWDDATLRSSIWLVPISREQDGASIEAYWQANGLTMPYNAQTGRKIYSLFASVSIPRIYVFSADGIILHVYDDSYLPTADALRANLSF